MYEITILETWSLIVLSPSSKEFGWIFVEDFGYLGGIHIMWFDILDIPLDFLKVAALSISINSKKYCGSFWIFTDHLLGSTGCSSSPLDKKLKKALWKYKSPRQINFLIWIMFFGVLKKLEELQRSFVCLPQSSLYAWLQLSLHGICFSDCSYSTSRLYRILADFNINWIFGIYFKENTLQPLMDSL